MKNPLISPILAILAEHENGISEFELLRELEQRVSVFDELGDDAKLVLFRKHFLIMNALYQLQIKLWQEDDIKLDISPLNIFLSTEASYPHISNSTAVEDTYEAKLAAYYLDWDEFDNTNAEDVELLLQGFYKKLNGSSEDTKMAREVLGVKENCSKSEVKLAYRRCVHKAHPDKGGDPKAFIQLRQAYEHLINHI